MANYKGVHADSRKFRKEELGDFTDLRRYKVFEEGKLLNVDTNKAVIVDVMNSNNWKKLEEDRETLTKLEKTIFG